MDQKILKRRWLIILIFFCFLFVQQFDVLMVDLLRFRVESMFGSTAFSSENSLYLFIFFAILSYLFWGISFDRHSRRNLLVLSGAFWWATSWLTGLAPTFETFIISYLTGLLDFGSMTGVYTLVGDYLSPKSRGKIFGLLQTAQPIAYILVLEYFQDYFSNVNWRTFLIISGIIGITIGLVIFLFVREPKRGQREPALIGIRISGQYFFDWEIARDIAVKPSFLLLCGLSLFSVLPWTGFSLWISTYLHINQNLINESVYLILLPIIIALILGNVLGGILGDSFFRWKKRGRVITNISVMGLALLTSISAFLIGDVESFIFRVLVSITALFIAMGRPNIFAMLYDITLPEIRGTATSMLFISQLVGVGVSWALIRVMRTSCDLWTILFSLTLTSIAANLLLSTGLFQRMPIEIENLRRHMAYRSQLEARLESQKN